MIELSQFFVNSAISYKLSPNCWRGGYGDKESLEVVAQIDEVPSSKVMVFLLQCGEVGLIH